jgi:ribonucleoside-diphosphate reductase alpha chain
LKGITIFRDGCRDDQIVHFGKKDKKRRITDKKMQRPIKRDGATVEIKTPHGKFFVTVNFYEDKPIEMFFSIGKQGGMVNVVIDALARICSKGLQAGMDMTWIIDTLEGLKGDHPFWFKISDNEEKQQQAESIVDALSKVLSYHFSNDRPLIDECESETGFSRCPECGKKALTHSTGCRGGECVACGFTNCS